MVKVRTILSLYGLPHARAHTHQMAMGFLGRGKREGANCHAEV